MLLTLQVADIIQCFAAGLQSMGVGSGDRMALFAEKSSRHAGRQAGRVATGLPMVHAMAGCCAPALPW